MADVIELISNQELGQHLELVRVARGLTQPEVEVLTKKLGLRVTASRLSAYERGVSAPPIDKLRVLLPVLQRPPTRYRQHSPGLVRTSAWR